MSECKPTCAPANLAESARGIQLYSVLRSHLLTLILGQLTSVDGEKCLRVLWKGRPERERENIIVHML